MSKLNTNGEGIQAVWPKRTHTIYLVIGSTGEYSGHTEWNVKAFTSKEKAWSFLESLEATIKSAAPDCPEFYETNQRNALEKALIDLDPKVQVDYTGITYEIEEIELEE